MTEYRVNASEEREDGVRAITDLTLYSYGPVLEGPPHNGPITVRPHSTAAPDGEVEVTMHCPVCRAKTGDLVDCEVDADGWRCEQCGSTWDHEGRNGETPVLACVDCGQPFEPDDPPPPTCRVSGGYCTTKRVR